MSRLHLLTNYDDMTINKKEEGYVRVMSSVGTCVCGDVRVFWKHRHIVIPARNPFTFSEISNDDQRVTMALQSSFRSSFGGSRAKHLPSFGNVHYVHRTPRHESQH